MLRLKALFILSMIALVSACSIVPDLPGPIGIPGI